MRRNRPVAALPFVGTGPFERARVRPVSLGEGVRSREEFDNAQNYTSSRGYRSRASVCDPVKPGTGNYRPEISRHKSFWNYRRSPARWFPWRPFFPWRSSFPRWPTLPWWPSLGWPSRLAWPSLGWPSSLARSSALARCTVLRWWLGLRPWLWLAASSCDRQRQPLLVAPLLSLPRLVSGQPSHRAGPAFAGPFLLRTREAGLRCAIFIARCPPCESRGKSRFKDGPMWTTEAGG